MKTCHKNGLQSATKEMDSEVRRWPHKCTYHVWYTRKPLPRACQRFWLYMCKNTDLNGILKTSLTIEQGLLALTLVGNLSLEEKLFCDMVITQQFFPSCQLFNSKFVTLELPSILWCFLVNAWHFEKSDASGKNITCYIASCCSGYQQWNSELFMLHFLRANRRISKLLRHILEFKEFKVHWK